ncbi:acyl-CoA N-acyltransferase [Cytidiella melzeri]|nr:acyl-CoA N-acyltransferase [Cytidiella melzeri]
MGLSLVFSNDTVARVASRDNAGYDWQTTFYLVAQLIGGDPQDQLSYYILTRKGIADIADNWRNRAHENGIKVGEESRFADDEDDDDDIDLDTSSFFSADRALLPVPFLSTQRRARAFTQALPHVPALPALRTSQNSVLGKGKRARGITVTRSNQEELMRSGHLMARDHSTTRKRKHSVSPSIVEVDGAEAVSKEVKLSEEEYDIEHHKQITAKRNFDKVNFGKWQIKTWYFSPYPLIETETDEVAPSSSVGASGSHGAPLSSSCIPGAVWEKSRYRREIGTRKCTRRHPPGRKVYQRGAHIIWEVDGAKEKLYCQNFSLFGKLFIDIKTLFFDCDNFLFYILTDADSQRDHVLGFFPNASMVKELVRNARALQAEVGVIEL